MFKVSDDEQYRPSKSQLGTHSQAAFLLAHVFVTGGAGELEPPPLLPQPSARVEAPSRRGRGAESERLRPKAAVAEADDGSSPGACRAGRRWGWPPGGGPSH